MTTPRTLVSAEDASINYVMEAPSVGLYEARYVRRQPEYFIIYLSAQSGCDQACRMCHLTATGQNRYVDASFNELMAQAQAVYNHYDRQPPAAWVHYNFMARGEALNSTTIRQEGVPLLHALGALARSRGLASKYLISTILPQSLGETELVALFDDPQVYPEFYYSLYSVNPDFRRRWLPRALPAEEGLARLARWQQATGKVPKIHFAFIEGENDAERDMHAMADAIENHGLRVDLNIVRYNPYSDKQGRESSLAVIERNVGILTDRLHPENVRIVPKVGFDVKASCGMFVSG